MIIKNDSSHAQVITVSCSIILPPGAVLKDADIFSPLPEGGTIKEDLSEVYPRSRVTSMTRDEKKETSWKQKLND